MKFHNISFLVESKLQERIDLLISKWKYLPDKKKKKNYYSSNGNAFVKEN